MPRFRRLTAEGSVQHVISRFVNRERRFDVHDARAEYLRRAARALHAVDWRALAFAMMSSHVHWALRAGHSPSAAWVKPLHAGFATWLNVRQGRLGPVFADRHRSVTFEAETAAALLAYIHNNPVRAGIVADPADSPWTSHRAYLGLVQPPPWLDVHRGLALAGFSATPSGRLAFHEMVIACRNDARRVDFSGGDLQRRRRNARAIVRLPIEVCSPTVALESGVAQALPEPDLDCPVSGPSPAWRGEASVALALIAHATGADVAQLQSQSRRRNLANLRRVALLTWTRELRRPAIELARVLGLSSSSASELIRTASASVSATASVLGRELRGEDD